MTHTSVRIGAYGPDLPAHDEHPLSIGPGDLRTLFRRSVEAEFQGFHVVYGVSAQPTAPYDLAYTRELLTWDARERPVATGAQPASDRKQAASQDQQ